ncbi:MAG: type II secretion system protein [Betaproteobacteria bacterium]|nr:type II secretion system protein [Betaproteobacteria bacterium]
MKQQQGFTLIELIVVIVILAILAATALPRFVSLQNDARFSSARGAQGAITSAAALVHSAIIVAGSSVSGAGSAVMEGATINTLNGYPDGTAGGIFAAAQLVNGQGYTLTPASPTAAGQVQVTPTGVSTPASCWVTYQAPAAAGGAPTITFTAATSAGCS